MSVVAAVAFWSSARVAKGQEPASSVVSTSAGEEAARTRAAVLGKKISLHLLRSTLGEALKAISTEAGVRLIYSRYAVPVRKPVSLVVDTITVGDALALLLRDTGAEAVVSPSGWITLRTVEDGRDIGEAGGVAQQGVGAIAGQVVDAVTRLGLDRVNVFVEGPGLKTTTGADGKYTVAGVASGVYRVTARRVGYTPLTKDVTIAADRSATLDFALAAAPTKLDEVVTTAVGQQRRYEVGNDISTINADSIAPTAPLTSLTDLISARAPGVQILETSGMTGSGEAIRIRGQSSLVLQGDPIVIVDGVRQDNTPGGTVFAAGTSGSPGAVPSPGRLNDLDFTQVESVDVLKGPAASTEYGTDAANGVIVITTKHGTAGRPQWTASAEQTASAIPERFPALYHSWGHRTDGSNTSVECPLVPYAFGSGYGSTAGTCVVDSVTQWNPLNASGYSIFGTGNRAKYDVSVAGGSSAARYFVAGSLSHETGILQMPDVFRPQAEAVGLPSSNFRPNGEDQRSMRANTAVTVGPTADLTVTGAYLTTYEAVPNAQQLYAGVASGPAIRNSSDLFGYGTFPTESPIYQFGLPTSQSTERLTGGVTGNWRPTSWLMTHGTMGVDHGSERIQAALLPQLATLYAGYQPQLEIGNQTRDIYSVDLRASATAAIARTLRSVTSFGIQLADTRLQGTTATAMGISVTNETLNGAVNPAVTQLGNRQATLGGYAEEEVGLADRLFVTGAVRVDAGSGFGRSYSTAAYPKASISWLVVNDGPATLRVRGAFGESGVQPPNGAALQLYAPTLAVNGGTPASAVAIANVENRLLQPERSAEYEGGVDIGLWQGRASIELTGYSKTTHDALVGTGTGWELGSYPYEENIGSVRNVGVEGAITTTLIRARALTWDMSLNASVNHNKLVSLAPGVLSQELVGVGGAFFFRPGFPLYGYWAPRVQYVDANHDGLIESNEVTVADSLSYIGPSAPTQEASLGAHVGLWRGAVAVAALMDYRGGFRLMNTTALFAPLTQQTDAGSNVPRAPLWQQARDVSAILTEVEGLNNYASPSGFAEEAAYVRFRELSVTYELPQRVTRAVRLHSLSITGAVRNLALWTRYSGPDPEVSNAAGNNAKLQSTSNTYVINQDLREDYGSVPLLRYWVARLNVGF